MRLVLADPHADVLDAIQQAFEGEPDLDVVARCQDGAQTLRAVRSHQPDILIADLHQLEMGGFDLLQALKKQSVATRVIMFTARIDEDEVIEAIRLGVRGFVLKQMKAHVLVQCVRKVRRNDYWLETHSIARALDKVVQREEALRRMRDNLSLREIEIAEMVVAHLRNKEIGDKLHISEGTVKSHLHNIYRKLHLAGRRELAAAAL
jgi:two-component system, NarL family, nitrate/nitrite response regulator NarL